MHIVDVNRQSSEEWRAGVVTRMKASAANSATQLCLFEQWCDPGHGAPVIVPAGRKHGFSNIGQTVLHIESTLAAPVFEAAYEDKRETPRRWLPGSD